MDRQRLAAALAYEEERRRRLMESVPVIDDSAPTTQPRRSLRSDLENLSSGLGQAGVNILEGGKALLTDPIGTVKGTYETVKGVVRDPSLIADALRYTADKAMSGPLGAGEVIGEMVNPIRFRRTPVMQEIDVYHGSPHRFEEFDASKIGTGEGAQAYGHGIYFAENPSVAEGYRKTLGEQQNPYKANVAMSRMAALVDEFDGDVEKAADRFMQSVYETPKTKAKMRQNLIDEFQTYSPKGQLYKADLPDEMVDRMLDWDKPLSEQPKVLRALLNSDDEWKAYTAQLSPKSRKLAEDMAIGAKPNTGDEAFKLFKQLDADNPNADHNAIYDVIRKYNPRTTDQDWIMSMMSGSAAPGAGIRGGGGADLYNTLGGGKQAAQRLRAAGIPGMQYLDAGSRGQGGSGTRNFVVFPGEEKKVKILERNGEKLAAALGTIKPKATVIEARATRAGRNLPDLEAELAAKNLTIQPNEKGGFDVYGRKVGFDPAIPQKLTTVKEGGRAAAIQAAKNIGRKADAELQASKTRNPFTAYAEFGNLDDYIADRPDLLEKLMRKKLVNVEPEIESVQPSFKNKNYRVRFKTGEEFSVENIKPETLDELKATVRKDLYSEQIPDQLQGKTVKDLISALAWEERSEKYIKNVLTGKKRLRLED